MRIKYILVCISILLISATVMSGCMPAVRPYASAPESADAVNSESGTATGQTTVDISRANNADYYKFYDDIIINTLKEDGMNVVSPVNIYCCTSLLAQTAAGNTQKQMLDALGASDSADLSEKTKKITASFYRNEEFMKTLSANSLWLDDRLNVKEDCADKLKKEYAAHIGKGRFSDEKYLAEMNRWLSEKTGGLLDGKVKKEADDKTRVMLLSTLYLSARWDDVFYYDSDDKTLFNEKTVCRYMKCVSMDTVYFGDGFTAYKKPFLDYDGAVWLFLPDEDKTVYDVISKRPVEYIFSKNKTVKNGLEVHLTVPEFDVCSDGKLNGALKSCGISDAFDARADFSPLTDEPLLIDAVTHAARVKADREGLEAAAYTGVTYAPGSAKPQKEPEKYNYDLYRTFFFVITDINDVPLFAGIVGDDGVK